MGTKRTRKKRPGVVKPQAKIGALPGTRTLNLRIKSQLLCSLLLSELLSNNANTCQDLPFRPTARIRAVL